MGSLAGKSPSTTYKSLLKTSDETNGISGVLKHVEDGEGTTSCMALSTDLVWVFPKTTNGQLTFLVQNKENDNLLSVDTSNDVVKAGTTQTVVNSQLLEFNAFDLTPVAGTHYFVGRGSERYNSTDAAELANGTGTDPATSYDGGATTDELISHLFLVPVASTIDAVKFMVSTDSDTDTIINVHLYKFTITNAGSTSDGNLTGGTLLANGQATSVDRNVIKTVTCTIDSANVTANKVIACFVENETNTDDIRLQTQVLYHFN